MILFYGLCYLVIAVGAGQNFERDERVDGHRRDADAVGIRRVKDNDDANRRVRQSSRRRRILKERV